MVKWGAVVKWGGAQSQAAEDPGWKGAERTSHSLFFLSRVVHAASTVVALEWSGVGFIAGDPSETSSAACLGPASRPA